MFSSSRNKSHRESFGYRAGKAPQKQRSFKDTNKSFRDPVRSSRIIASSQQQTSPISQSQYSPSSSTPTSPNLNSAIITLSIGPTQRLFAAHEDVLTKSPYLAQALRSQFFATTKRIDLPTEEPEVFSAVLEYLYKGDYTPNLAYDKKRSSWYLAESEGAGGETTIHLHSVGGAVLKDTAIYCTAHTFALPNLQRLALKKQGLASGVQCSTILSSARFAYSHTPASDSKLRAHYLALIIRSRGTFKRSGTMQAEMERGGSPLFFDLFVAMVNHLDDVSGGK